MARNTGFGRALQQIRKPDQQSALAQPDGVVNVGEGEELDLQFGRGAMPGRSSR